jgi:hypothetical protein
MSDISNITNVTIDRLTADLDGILYNVTSMTLKLLLNKPAVCELVLALGESVRRGNRGLSSTGRLSGFSMTGYTGVVVNLYKNGDKTPIVLFRGFVSSISNIAAKNASGSYAGVVINAVAPPVLMGRYSLNGYRYWNTKGDSKGSAVASKSDYARRQLLRELGDDKNATIFTSISPEIQAADDYAAYIVEVTGRLTKYISKDRYPVESVTENFDTRGRKLLPATALVSKTTAKTQGDLIRYLKGKMVNGNPYAAVQSIASGMMFLNLVPLPCGKMDIIPAFPWTTEVIGTIRRRDILNLRDSTALSAVTEDLDSVMVPVPFGRDVALANYAEWPPDINLATAGVSKVVSIPAWLSPFVNSTVTTEKATDAQKTNKGTKEKKEEIDEKADEYNTVGVALAKAFFAELKNVGVTTEVQVQWHRLEFLDALGYLMEIEQPVIDKSVEQVNLFGYLAGAAMKVKSTPGGSSASLTLSFTHVRDAYAQEIYALDSHPIYNITGGPVQDLQAFLAKPGREYTRSVQQTLEGGSYDSYLNTVVNNATSATRSG